MIFTVKYAWGNGGGGHASDFDPCRSTIAKNAVDDKEAWRRGAGVKWLPCGY
jgi:hypothetical protein